MKNFSIVAPSFWLRGSGKKLRGNANAQVLALYFMTAPAASLIGMYYQPVTTILHETGLTREAFDEALPAVAEIAQYDMDAELVWLPEAAAWQIGDSMKPSDNRQKGLARELSLFGEHPFAREFVMKYREAYGLHGHPLATPLEGGLRYPSKGISYVQKGLVLGKDLGMATDQGVQGAGPVPLAERAKAWKRDPNSASLKFPNPEAWPEIRGLCELLAAIFGGRPEYPRSAADPRCRVVIERLAADIPLSLLTLAIRGSKHVDYIREKPENQTLMTILRDDAQPDKFAKFERSSAPSTSIRPAQPDCTPQPKPSPRPLDPEAEKLQAALQRPKLAVAPAPDPEPDRPTQGNVAAGRA